METRLQSSQRLYYIVTLHQTTTKFAHWSNSVTLYYIVSLHQTTTCRHPTKFNNCCIISFLYIKPQLPTCRRNTRHCCIISFLYIKPQLIQNNNLSPLRCIISFLYIKPQPNARKTSILPVVLYRFSTSNHNLPGVLEHLNSLYYIVSLHQTTTIT